MKNYYYLDSKEERQGPLTIVEIKSSKTIHKDTLVWCEGMPEWKKAGELEEFDEKELPPAPPGVKKTNLSIKFSKKSKKITFLTIVFLLLIVTTVFFYRNYLLNKALNEYKLTGYFDSDALKTAYALKSDYAGALLTIHYVNEDNSLYNLLYDELKESDDWRVQTILGYNLNKNKNKISTIQSMKYFEEYAENDWFWQLYYGLVLIDNREKFEDFKNLELGLNYLKKSADNGCVVGTRLFAKNTLDEELRCEYYDKLLNSDYRNEGMLSGIMAELSTNFIQGKGCDSDYVKALEYAQKACDSDNYVGCIALNLFYSGELPKGPNRNEDLMFQYATKSAELGLEINDYLGSYMLALCYQDGVGTKKDYSKYKELVKQAADGGLKEAKDRLKIINRRSSSSSSLKSCKCCSKQFHGSNGWGYSSGAYRSGTRGGLGILDKSLMGFSNKTFGRNDKLSKYYDIYYCSKRCADYCK